MRNSSCGINKEVQACCLPKDEAGRAKEAAAQQIARDGRAAARRQELRAVREAIMTRLAVNDADDGEDLLTTASNAVVDLVRAGRLDEAEAAARDLIMRYPDAHDGWDRLGIGARGARRDAPSRRLLPPGRRLPPAQLRLCRASLQGRAARADRQARAASGELTRPLLLALGEDREALTLNPSCSRHRHRALKQTERP